MPVDTFDYTQYIQHAMEKFDAVRIDEKQYSYLDESLPTFPYIIDYSGICIVCRKKKSDNYSFWINAICSYLVVKKKMISFENSKVNLLIEYFDGDSIVEKYFDRETVLSQSGVKLLLGCGVSFKDSCSKSFLDYLLISDKSAEVEHYHYRLGWDTDAKSGIPVFKLNQSLCQKDTLSYTSKYAGNLDMELRGNAETWLNLIKESVLPYTPLTFCMLLGFAAPILSLLYEKYDLGTLIFSLSNDSSKGKTTAAALAASVFSNPILGRGTVQSFCCTQNYLISFLTATSGLTVSLDEGATYIGDLNQLFYTISSGKERGRLTKESVMKQPLQWNSIVITTAEFNPIDDSSPNGLRTRCFCITDDLTVSAEQADKIKTIISQSYGAVGVQFIEWLLNTNGLDVDADYIECKNVLFQSLKESGASEGSFTSRAFSRLAVILQTADYVSQCFSLDIDTDSLIKYIVGLERKINVDTDLSQTAIDSLLSEISCTSSHYISKNNINPGNVFGRIEERDHMKVISIIIPEFKRICKKFDMQPMVVLKKFKERGILESESDRQSKRVKLGPDIPEMACYVLKIEDSKTTINTNSLIPAL